MMRNSILLVLVMASFLGCNAGAVKDEAGELDSVVGQDESSSNEKTADDAQKYMQEQIDRYLGGQRTDEQLRKITHGSVFFQIVEKGMIHSINIANVLPAFSDSGEKRPNSFKVLMTFSGENWSESVETDLTYLPDKMEWLAI